MRLTLLAVLLASVPALAQVPAGGEVRVNTYTTGPQALASVSFALNGDFVVAWQDTVEGDYYGVMARRHDARGNPIGSEFLVNTTTADYQVSPVVGLRRRGDFAVIWHSFALDGTRWNVMGQRYDALAHPRGGEFQVNSFSPGSQFNPIMAMTTSGVFVVVWSSPLQDGSSYGVFGQRYDAAGNPAGGEFRVNTYTIGAQFNGDVATNAAGDFVVVWHSPGQDGSLEGVFGQRYDASGATVGGEFQVNTYTTGRQMWPYAGMSDDGSFAVAWQSHLGGEEGVEVRGRLFDAAGQARGAEFAINTRTADNQVVWGLDADARGNFVVAWTETGADGSEQSVTARRFHRDGTPRGPEFRVNTYTTGMQYLSRLSVDPVGNFAVTWLSRDQDGSSHGAYMQRYGGLVPSALAVDSAANGILEPGESVAVRPSWRNVNGSPQTFAAGLSQMSGPAGATYTITDPSGDYGAVADGATASCTDCYAVSVSDPAARPATHWDASVVESITPDAQGQEKTWPLHVGRSFHDVPAGSPSYRFVEALLHNGVTAGCTADAYCPAAAITRQQMAVFVLVAKEEAGFRPAACGTPLFGDVPASSPFCPWIEELARRGVASGCGAGNFCPSQPVTREQMAVFVLRTLDPALTPPACTAPMFGDVPASSPFCRWIEELARRGVVSGCGGGNYCPADVVTREQMAVFVAVTFALTLYGP
jgi:hypothetical protein